MLPKPRRPREKRFVELKPVTYTIAEFSEMTGIRRVRVLRLINSGLLRVVRLGNRRLILATKPLRAELRI